MLQTQQPKKALVGTQEIEQRLQAYQTYARSENFQIAAGDNTCFDHKTRTVYLARSELESAREIRILDFDVQHELGHLMQLFADPKGYRKLIDDCRNDRAKFTFYNCLLDIAVNSFIPNRSALYRGKDNNLYADFVGDYYKNTLFPSKDLSAKAYCIQFSMLLLLEGMDCANKYTVSPIVRDALDRQIKTFGASSDIGDFLRRNFREPKNAGKFTVGNLRFLADQGLLKIFEELRAADIKCGNVIEDSGIKPGILSSEDFEEAIKSAIEVHGIKTISAQEKAKQHVLGAINKDLNEAGKEANDFAERCARQKTAVLEMVNLWQKIRHSEEDVNMQERSGYTSGHRLDIRKAIKDFPALNAGTPELPIMIRNVVETQTEIQPKKINLHLVLDLSGSMESAIDLVKDQFVIVFGSIDSYSKSKKEEWPSINSALHIYSDTGETLLQLDQHTIADFFQAYKKVETKGGTNSHLGLALVKKAIPDSKAKGARTSAGTDTNEVNILIEITDGETSEPLQSRAIIDELKESGFICCGIKFVGATQADRPQTNTNPNTPQPESIDTGSFKTIYAERGKQIVARDFNKALYELLQDVIEE